MNKPTGQPSQQLPPALGARVAVLECVNVCKEFGETVKTRVLSDVSLTIIPGEFVCLTGPSGSGKSTLLYLLGALDRPSSGHVIFRGQDLGLLDDRRRAGLRLSNVGFVFQFHFLLPEFTVLENVALPLLRAGRVNRSAALTHASEVLERFELLSLAQRYPHQLSGGQQQRVSIARALCNDPDVILADEPTGNLDRKNAHIVVSLLSRLVEEKGVTVVMVTHDAQLAADRREVVLVDGRITRDIRR